MARRQNEEVTRNGYICGFYLSRFDKVGRKELGYKTWTETYEKIGNILDYDPDTIKNNRDAYDSFHDNPRVGWNPATLTEPEKDIRKEFKHYDFVTLTKIVKNILGIKLDEAYSETNLKQQVEKEKAKLNKERSLEEKQCVLALCQIEGGETEVPVRDDKSSELVGLADLITEKEIIEVKNIKNWKHAVGQIFAYWYYHPLKNQLKPRIHLFGGDGINDPKIELCKSLMKQVFSPYTNYTRVTYIENFDEYDQDLYTVIQHLIALESWSDIGNISEEIMYKAWQFLTEEEDQRLHRLHEQDEINRAVVKLKTTQSWGNIANLPQKIIDKAWKFLTEEEDQRLRRLHEQDEINRAVVKLKTTQSWGNIANLPQKIIDKAWKFLTEEEDQRLRRLHKDDQQANKGSN